MRTPLLCAVLALAAVAAAHETFAKRADPPPPVDLDHGLIARFGFDGDARDSVTNRAAKAHGHIAYEPGPFGRAMKLGGVDDPGYLTIPDDARWKLDKAMTVACWVRIDADAGQSGANCAGRKIAKAHHAIVAREGDRVGWVLTSKGEDGPRRYLHIANGFSPRQSAAAAQPEKPIGTWHHVAAVAGADGTRMYLDGKLVSHDRRPAHVATSNGQTLYIGMMGGKGSCRPRWYPLHGALDELRLYNRALSDAEIRTLASRIILAAR